MTELRHGFYLTYGETEDGRMLAICSDGTPQLGHKPVTVLTLEVVENRKEAKRWFKRVIVEQPWKERH